MSMILEDRTAVEALHGCAIRIGTRC